MKDFIEEVNEDIYYDELLCDDSDDEDIYDIDDLIYSDDEMKAIYAENKQTPANNMYIAAETESNARATMKILTDYMLEHAKKD